MKPYELVLLLHPDLEIDLDKPLKKVEKIINDANGKITTTDVWGKRKLAYRIAKQEFAIYVYYEVELPGESVGQLERNFNITDEILRYLLTYPVPVTEEPKEEEATTNSDDKEPKPTTTKTKAPATKKVTAKAAVKE